MHSYVSRCDEKYVEFPTACIHENILIGVCAGVGGAIILALVISTTVLAIQKKNLKKAVRV